MSENDSNKSVVTTYRLKEDTKADIKKQLDQLGLTQEEYFKKVVTMMELENIKKNKLFTVNTDELQELTQRIYNMFINMCEQGNSFFSSKDIELEELKTKYKDMLLNKDNKIIEQKQELQDAQTKIDVLQKENSHNKLEMVDNKLKHEKQIDQFENNLKDKTLIVEEYKEKNDMLLSDLQEHKKYKEQYKELEGQLEQYKKNNDVLVTNKTLLENKIIKLEDKINNDSEIIAFYKIEIDNKNKSIESYKNDIKMLEIKKDKDIDNIKIEHKKALEERENIIKEQLNNKYELEIANKNSEIEKLNNSIEKLKLRKFKIIKNK